MNTTTKKFSRRLGEDRPCDAQDANAWHPCPRPVAARLVRLLMNWGWVAVLLATLAVNY